MTIKGLLLGAVLLILAIASTLTIFQLYEGKQTPDVESQPIQAIQP